MQKHLLFLAIMATFVSTLSAQQNWALTSNQCNSRSNKTSYVERQVEPVSRTAPMKTLSINDNQIWWGYFTTDQQLYLDGFRKTETYECALYIPADYELLQGATIGGIKIRFMKVKNFKNVKVWMTTKLGEYNITTQDATVEKGYNEIAFKQPYTMGKEGVYVGYSFTVDKIGDDLDNLPLIYSPKQKTANSYFLRASSSQPQWTDMKDKGLACIQCLVSGGKLKKNAVVVDEMLEDHCYKGTAFQYVVNMRNQGTAGVKSFDYTYELDGEKLSQHVDLTNGAPQIYDISGGIVLSITTGNAGAEKMTFSIDKVNGEVNETADQAKHSTIFASVDKSYPRTTVMEYITGTWDGYSPKGFAAMKHLQATYPNDFIGMAVHYNDIMALPSYTSYVDKKDKVEQIPLCTMNRNDYYWCDVYSGAAEDNGYHIPKIFDMAQEEASEGMIAITSKYTDNTKSKIELTSKSTFCYDRDDCPYGVAYILLENGITGGKDYNQVNYYCDPNIKTDFQDDSYMADYVNGKDTIEGMKFNDVVIGTYDCLGVEGSLQGAITNGSEKSHNYLITLPSTVQNKDSLYLVAMLVNMNNGRVINAVKTRIGQTTGIHTTESNNLSSTVKKRYGELNISCSTSDLAKAEMYSLDGRLIQAQSFTKETKMLTSGLKGVYIIRITSGNNVSVRKIEL